MTVSSHRFATRARSHEDRGMALLGDQPLQFQLLGRDSSSRARVGRVTTRHGTFDTPAFMPVGTQGTVKGLTPDHIAATGAQIVLANTYHLMLRPSEKVVRD